MVDRSDRWCTILLAMGGPDAPGDIREYLYNIFSDRSLIRLPGGRLFQKPFAKLISRLRSKRVQEHYGLIGGASPLMKWTSAQAALVEQDLSRNLDAFKCYVGMRYFRPTIRSAVRKAYEDGFRKVCFVPMYPQYSVATVGSSFAEATRVLEEMPGMEAVFINDFHDEPGYAALLKDYIESHIGPEDTLLFSAHSLPQKFVDEGDPYVDQVRRTAQMVAADREYFVSFQSRTGPVTWVGPDTVAEARRLLSERSGGLFVVPISFVCDHIETLYEIDIELKELLGDKGDRLRRMPMFNDDRRLAEVLGGLILRRMRSGVTI
ncbi:MAG: ferrochelatase [candidate division Zixibacteria bacterium]|nr:ferrochelatase [candidate division Zixibacteria bacterium]